LADLSTWTQEVKRKDEALKGGAGAAPLRALPVRGDAGALPRVAAAEAAGAQPAAARSAGAGSAPRGGGGAAAAAASPPPPTSRHAARSPRSARVRN
jgi:hypothetical protein